MNVLHDTLSTPFYQLEVRQIGDLMAALENTKRLSHYVTKDHEV